MIENKSGCLFSEHGVPVYKTSTWRLQLHTILLSCYLKPNLFCFSFVSVLFQFYFTCASRLRRNNSNSWLTVSKAAVKSSRQTADRKPNWLSSVVSRDWNLSRKQYSNTLEITGLMAIPRKSLQCLSADVVRLGNRYSVTPFKNLLEYNEYTKLNLKILTR